MRTVHGIVAHTCALAAAIPVVVLLGLAAAIVLIASFPPSITARFLPCTELPDTGEPSPADSCA